MRAPWVVHVSSTSGCTLLPTPTMAARTSGPCYIVDIVVMSVSIDPRSDRVPHHHQPPPVSVACTVTARCTGCHSDGGVYISGWLLLETGGKSAGKVRRVPPRGATPFATVSA